MSHSKKIKKALNMSIDEIQELYPDLFKITRMIIEAKYNLYYKDDAAAICLNVVKYHGPNATKIQIISEIETFYNA